MFDEYTQSLAALLIPSTILAIAAGGLAFLAVTATVFLKISVVLFIIRNALGLQQIPSNLIINAFALILALAVSKPLIEDVDKVVRASQANLSTWAGAVTLVEEVSVPLRASMMRRIDPADADLTRNALAEAWKVDVNTISKNDIAVVFPAFIISELTQAFMIGFLLYIPFITVDLVVTVILLALGLNMVMPNIISTPFKLMLFVAIGGWSQLVDGLLKL
jgi:type III secretion protein R